MKIGELINFLKLLPPSQSVLILGPPGVGKSTVVRRFAELEAQRLQKEFVDYNEDDEQYEKIIDNPERYYVYIDFRLTELEPSDLIGVPRDENGTITYKPLRWIKLCAKTAGLVFLDELTNVRREDILAASYKLVLDRRAGFVKLSDQVRVIAAGNRPEHSTVANLLPSPLINRFAVIEVEVTLDDWLEYVNENEGGLDPRVSGYLARFPTDLYKQNGEPETLENYPTPRSWSRLNAIIRSLSDGSDARVKEIAKSLLGHEVAEKFAAFCRLQRYLPSPEEILKNPNVLFNKKIEEDGLTKIDLLYYAVAAVASYLSTSKAKVDDQAIIKFLEKLVDVQADLLVVFLKLLPASVKKRIIIQAATLPAVQQIASAITKYL